MKIIMKKANGLFSHDVAVFLSWLKGQVHYHIKFEWDLYCIRETTLSGAQFTSVVCIIVFKLGVYERKYEKRLSKCLNIIAIFLLSTSVYKHVCNSSKTERGIMRTQKVESCREYIIMLLCWTLYGVFLFQQHFEPI